MLALASSAFLLAAALPAASVAQNAPSLADILSAHLAALSQLHVVPAKTLETQGSLSGLGLQGTFHTWRDGNRERYDERLGIRDERTLRDGDVEMIQNANGAVRVLHGLLARRQLTDRFIDSGDFARHPDVDRLLGPAKLADGREVWQLRVEPPGGEPYGISLDAHTWLVDEKAYQDGDALVRETFADYKVVDGTLVAYSEIDSSGDAAFDMTSRVTSVAVNRPIDAAVFAPFRAAVLDAPAPVTVPLVYEHGHVFVRATAHGTPLLFLLDSGSQGIFLDPSAAQRLGLQTEGRLEVRGARRTVGNGVAALDALQIGDARLPVGVVSVVDLSAVQYHNDRVDGVLGYPFFAAAEVRIDPDRFTMTAGKPGSLPPLGAGVPIDTDRELPEAFAKVDGVAGRFLIDTGNTNELLIFHGFINEHPGLVTYRSRMSFAQNRGVGGSSSAIGAVIDSLELGPYKFYNRNADVMLSETGAFADRNEAGNIGFGTLRNFVFTFDYASRTLYLDRGRSFDDGRFRAQTEPIH